MDKLRELREKFKNLTDEIRTLNNEGKVNEATAKLEERKKVEKQIEIELSLQDDEERELEAQRRKRQEKGLERKAGRDKHDEFRSTVKYALGHEMTDEERATVKTSDNEAVIPDEFINDIIKIQKGYGSLKDLCDVRKVTKNKGTIPVIDLDQNEMKEIAEGEDIVDGSLVTTDIPFTCAKVGLIQSLSSELIEDAEVEIESLVKENFNNIAVAKENFKILKVIKDNATAINGATSYEDVEKALDASLPAVKNGLSTLTNVDGYVELKNKKDSNGQPLNLITIVNGVEMFHGKPIYTVSNEELPSSDPDNKFIYYIQHFKEAVKYCDRKEITIKKSEEAGFKDDTTKIRILERFIPVKGVTRSMKKIEFDK